MPRKKAPPRKKGIDFHKILNEITEEVFDDEEILSFGNINTVDIITFRKEILKIDNRDFPYMDIVLKMFYSKTYGNENLELTDEDIGNIKKIKNYSDFVSDSDAINEDFKNEKDEEDVLSEVEKEAQSIVSKMTQEWGGDFWIGEQVENLRNSKKNPFTTLVLALGRRSGKSFISALIAAYEVYKLLTIVTCENCREYFNKKSGTKCPNCGEILMNHPQPYYELTSVDDLFIIMSSTSTKQADDNILDKFSGLMITKCPFFEGKYIKNDQTKEVVFRSEYDFKYNEKQNSLGQPEHKGSIVVMLAGANAKAQHGRGSVLTIIDEFDLYNVEGVDTDKAVMEALLPASAKFRKTRGDGRVVMISMPGDKLNTEFQRYFKMGTNVKNKNFKRVLTFQMPTWEYNTALDKEFIKNDFSEDFGGEASSAKFHRVFGAQFVVAGQDVFIPEKYIKMSIDPTLYIQDRPRNVNSRHFMHIDCAGTGSANYAYLIGHWEMDHERKEKIFIEDRSFYWKYTDILPGKFIGNDGKAYDIEELLDEIIRISKVFKVNMISYDNMQSQESIHRFRKNGIMLKNITFSKMVKSKVYQLLEELLLSNKVKLCCDDELLIGELKNLRRKPLSSRDRGLHVFIPEDSEIQTMDLADSLGGAIYASYELPFGKTRNIPARVINTSLPNLQSLNNPGISGGANNRAGSIFGKNPRVFDF